MIKERVGLKLTYRIQWGRHRMIQFDYLLRRSAKASRFRCEILEALMIRVGNALELANLADCRYDKANVCVLTRN